MRCSPILHKYSSILFIVLIVAAQGCRKPDSVQVDIFAPSPMRCAPQLSDADWYATGDPAPVFEGMDLLHYPVTTTNPEAQKFFNQGLLFAYAFNHAEAARSFYHASRLDSTCAMCYWGYAFVLGPNYNAGMEPDNYARAYDAVLKARKWSTSATQKERDLIEAMVLRYSREVPDDRRHLDSAFMEAMKVMHHRYPDDINIAAIYAESLMDMHPWDLWEKDGTPRPWTQEIIRAIDVCIRLDPDHPGGHHYNIHAWEASPTPEKALVSAKKFDDGLVAKAGHLVHMPSHIYINTGDYHFGSLANINALKQDSMYVTQCHAQGAYPLAYYPHNYHFLTATATLEGKKEWAIDAAHKMARHVNHTGMLIPDLATLQHYYVTPYFVHVKFGTWEDILKLPAPDSQLVYAQAIMHYARGMAHLGMQDIEQAKAELTRLQQVSQDDTLKAMSIWGINSLYSVVEIGIKVLEGEIFAQEGKMEESIKLLQEAVVLEDALNYNEPPDWFFSVRHHLGAILLDAGRAREAIDLYKEDLTIFPKNGWALSGLKKAYLDNKQPDQAAATDRLLKEAWAHADIKLAGSRVQ